MESAQNTTTERIKPQSGKAFKLKKGKYLKVSDPMGQQVSDLVCFNLSDTKEWLSAGKTLDYANTILITKGHLLYSNRSKVMLEIIEDTNGRNDFLLAPCSRETFEIIYNHEGYHPSCHENLYTNLEPYGIGPDDIPVAFNVFMNVQVKNDGSFTVDPPTSKAGDYVLFKSHMDLLVGMTACSAGQSNNFNYKPIDYEILSEENFKETF